MKICYQPLVKTNIPAFKSNTKTLTEDKSSDSEQIIALPQYFTNYLTIKPKGDSWIKYIEKAERLSLEDYKKIKKEHPELIIDAYKEVEKGTCSTAFEVEQN